VALRPCPLRVMAVVLPKMSRVMSISVPLASVMRAGDFSSGSSSAKYSLNL
jgi:hypothetical protein